MTSSLLSDLGDELGDVVEEVGRGELVHARPQRGVAELHFLAHADQPLARGDLLFQRHRVLEVAQQDVHLGGDVGDLRDHLLVREVEEVDHPGGLEGDLPRGLGGVDREGLEEVSGVAQGWSPGVVWETNGIASRATGRWTFLGRRVRARLRRTLSAPVTTASGTGGASSKVLSKEFHEQKPTGDPAIP